MTFEEIENNLPNGFHDARINKINLDYVKRVATFDLEICVLDSEDETPEDYRAAKLTLLGLLFCVIEAPESTYPYYEGKSLCVDAGSSNLGKSSLTRLPEPLPEGAFAHWFFVNNWNAFIHVAAMDAQIILQ
jgi:hypothetical protein